LLIQKERNKEKEYRNRTAPHDFVGYTLLSQFAVLLHALVFRGAKKGATMGSS